MLRATLLLAILPSAGTAWAQGPDGGALFRQKCATCHVARAGAPAGLGPNLFRVVNRKAGSSAFAYSPALKSSKLTWTMANLDHFLRGPSQLVPGTRMPVAVPDNAQRLAIIGYLAAQK